MKTAVSIPDPLFKIADQTAQEMGIPRSQLFSLAVEEYLFHHSKSAITQKLNEVYKMNITNQNEYITDLGISSLRKATENDTW
jgi:hypothetical protein